MESAGKELKVIPRPYRIIRTVEKKLEIVKRVNNGEKLAEVCAKENIRKLSVLKWIGDKDKLESLLKAKQHSHMSELLAYNLQKEKKEKTKKTARFINQKIQDGLYSWYMSCIKDEPQMSQIRNRHIADKAKELNLSFGGNPDFTASASFLSAWKKKYKIETILLNHQQEKNQTVLEHFRERLLEIIEDDGLTSQQVFICGELKIDYKTLPTKESILHELEGKYLRKDSMKKLRSEIAPEQLSIMFCSNTAGTLKLPLMVIGNSMINSQEELPVYYKYRDQRNLIGGQAFEEWQKLKGIPPVRRFLQEQNLSPLALLIVSHFYTSGKIVGFNEKIAYLPPNASCITEPFNQKVLKELTIRFWLKIFSYILESRECGFDATNMNLEEALHLLDEAWNETSVEAFSYFWDFLPGDEDIKMMGVDINLLAKLVSLIKRFYGEESDELQEKEVETIEIDSEESEINEVEEVVVVHLDSEGRETNFERGENKTDFERSEDNFNEVSSSFREEEINLEFEEEEIKITVQDSENEKTESENETRRVSVVEIDEIKTKINSVEDSNTTLEECITSLETAIKFFKSRNKHEEFSEDLKLLRNLVNKACNLEIEMDTH